jgi:steroid delta-isomerase-like uncharacterized protein
MMTPAENLAIVRQVVAAQNAGDWAVLDPHPGLYETRQRFPRLRAAFPDLTLEIVDAMAHDDRVVLQMTMRGTHQGEFMGVAGSGKVFTANVVAIDRLENGKIVHHLAIADWLSILGTLGLVQPI